MKKVRIKGDPIAAAKAISSNRPFQIGDSFSANDTVSHKLVTEYGHLFEYMEPIVQTTKDVATEPEGIKSQVPSANKMLSKGKKFKSKKA